MLVLTVTTHYQKSASMRKQSFSVLEGKKQKKNTTSARYPALLHPDGLLETYLHHEQQEMWLQLLTALWKNNSIYSLLFKAVIADLWKRNSAAVGRQLIYPLGQHYLSDHQANVRTIFILLLALILVSTSSWGKYLSVFTAICLPACLWLSLSSGPEQVAYCVFGASPFEDSCSCCCSWKPHCKSSESELKQKLFFFFSILAHYIYSGSTMCM